MSTYVDNCLAHRCDGVDDGHDAAADGSEQALELWSCQLEHPSGWRVVAEDVRMRLRHPSLLMFTWSVGDRL